MAITVEILQSIFGYLSIVFFGMLLSPEIIHVWKRQSCKGLSGLMLILWLNDGLLFMPFLLQSSGEDLNVLLLVTNIVYTLLNCILLTQFVHYNPTLWIGSAPPKSWRRFFLSLSIFVGILALCSGVVVSCYFLFAYLNSIELTWLVFILGSVVPASSIVAGYIPQMMMLCKLKSTEGLSMAFLFVDLTGCITSLMTAVLSDPTFTEPTAVLSEALPYVLGTILQCVMICFKLFVYPAANKKPKVPKLTIKTAPADVTVRVDSLTPPPTPGGSNSEEDDGSTEDGSECAESDLADTVSQFDLSIITERSIDEFAEEDQAFEEAAVPGMVN